MMDHPKYHICLEEGRIVGMHMKEAWLRSQLVPGKFAEDHNNPFAVECYMSHGQTPIFPTSTLNDKLVNVWHKDA